MPNRRRGQRPRRHRARVVYGGSIDPYLVDQGLNYLANLIIPAALYGGLSYGVYRAVKK